MYKIWIVARREYLALVTTKSFWVGLLIPPVVGVLTVFMALSTPVLRDPGPARIVLVDHSRFLAKALKEVAKDEGFEVEQVEPAAWSEANQLRTIERLRHGELFAVVEVPREISDTTPVRVQIENVAASTARWLESTLRDAIRRERLRQAGLANHEIERLLEPVPVQSQRPTASLEPAPSDAGEFNVVLPLMALILIMMGVLSGAVPLLQAVVEEKQQRISELLLGAVAPAHLMLGKLLGTTAVGMTVLGCNLGTGIAVLFYAGLGEHLPILALAVAVCIAGVAMLLYGALFLALGSASSELKEAQGLLMPVMLLFLAPMMALPSIADAPNGSLAVTLSLFPFTAPLAMPVRLGITQTVPTWHILLCLALVALTTAVTIWAAGRVFRIGILSQGRLPSVRELARWIARG